MEKLSSGSELSKLSKENIRRTLDGLQEGASAILLFTLQWKELEGVLDQRFEELKSREDHLVLIENSVQERIKRIIAREEEFESRQRIEAESLVVFAKSIDDKLKLFETKHNQLVSMGKLAEKQLGELKCIESFIKQKVRQIKRREEEFRVKEKHFQQRYKDLQLERKQLESDIARNKLREKQLEELSQELRRQYELKDRNIQEKEKQIEKSFKDIQENEKKIEKSFQDIQENENKIEKSFKDIQGKEKKIEECFKDIAAREEQFDIKQRLETERRQCEINSSRELVLLGKSIKETMKQLDIKQNELEISTGKQHREPKLIETFVKYKPNDIKNKEKEFGLKEKHLRQCSEGLELQKKRHEECHCELKQKGKHLDKLLQELHGQQEPLDKNLHELELRERKLEVLSKQCKLQETRSGNGLCPVVKNEAIDSLSAKTVAGHSADTDIHFSAAMDGRNLQIFLNEHCNEHSSLVGEIVTALQQSLDPAKLVLDAMEGFYPPYLMKGDQAFKGDIARRSCIMLLDQLRALSPEIKPNVKEQAMKLAFSWIAEVRADVKDQLKVLGFMQLLASYNLVSCFDADELCDLLLNVAGHLQAYRILHAPGFFKKISVFIQNLVEGKEYFRAVNFICAFELANEFPPVPLLEKFWLDTRDEAKQIYRDGNRTATAKIKADTRRISDLKAIVECVEKHKLEAKYSHNKLKSHKLLVANLEGQVRVAKTKLNNLKQTASGKPCVQKQDVNGELGGQEQIVNGNLDSQKQRENMKQTPKDANSALLSGSVKSDKCTGKKRSLAAMSDRTDVNEGIAANPTSCIRRVPSTLPCPGDSFEGYVQQLIEKDRILEAIKYIFQSNMIVKFPPIPLLNNHLKTRKNAYEELSRKHDIPIQRQIMDVNKMIGAMRAVVKCVQTYELESEFPIDTLLKEIEELEKKKEEICRVLQNSFGESKPQKKLNRKDCPQQLGKKSCTSNADGDTAAAPVTSAAAAPATPTAAATAPPPASPSPEAATSKTAAPTSSTAPPPEANGSTHQTGPTYRNKRCRTASAGRHYTLSGHPSRNLHPRNHSDGVTLKYPFYELGRQPNLDLERLSYADSRNSFDQPQYYDWRAHPYGYRY